MSPTIKAALLAQASKALRASWCVRPQAVKVPGFGEASTLMARLAWPAEELAPFLLVVALGDDSLPAALDKLQGPQGQHSASGGVVESLMRSAWSLHHAHWVPQIVRFTFVCDALPREYLARVDSESAPDGDIHLKVRVFDTGSYELLASSRDGYPFELEVPHSAANVPRNHH